MAGKRFRKLKKKYKRYIEKSVKAAYQSGKYCLVFWGGDVSDFFYHKEDKVRKNERINFLANNMAKEELDSDMPCHVFCSVSRSVPRGGENHATGFGRVYAAALKGCNNTGKHFRKIVEDFDNESGLIYNIDEYDPYQSLNYRFVLDALIKLVNTYELLVFSDSGYIWRKDYLRKVARNGGLSYLPTVFIE